MQEAIKVLIFSQQEGMEAGEPKLTEKDIPSGFETVGDVAHMNFNQAQHKFRYQIG